MLIKETLIKLNSLEDHLLDSLLLTHMNKRYQSILKSQNRMYQMFHWLSKLLERVNVCSLT